MAIAHGYVFANTSGLFWDADGSGAGAAVKIANFANTPIGMTQASFSFA